jgi:hypothetical protein
MHRFIVAFTLSLIAGTGVSYAQNPARDACPGACWSPFLSLFGGIGGGTTTFNSSPAFDVNPFGGFFEVGAGAVTPLFGDVSVGARFSVLGSGQRGSTFYQPSNATYTVREDLALMPEFEMRVDHILGRRPAPDPLTIADFPSLDPLLVLTAGPVWDFRKIKFAIFNEYDLRTPNERFRDAMAGFTMSAGLEQAFGTMGPTTARLGVRFRFTHLPEHSVDIPGPVDVKSNTYYVGLGVTLAENITVSGPSPILPPR